MQQEDAVWRPPEGLVRDSAMRRLLDARGLADYEALWRWSVADVEGFWRAMWDAFAIAADGDPSRVLASETMPGAAWFPGVALSFPEHVFRDRDPAVVAIRHASEDGQLATWTWSELRDRTARVRAGLRALGVGRGDRVAAYLGNVPETVAAFLASASLGATWSCCSPDLGPRTVLDRFAQIEPKVLLATEGYRYGGRDVDRRAEVAELAAALPVERVVRLGAEWDAAFPPTAEPLAFDRVPFAHPLWILYSSGTTGLPKPIVHGHGGILLEYLKAWTYHHDVKRDDCVFWFSTTGWMMWNYLLGALLSGASIVTFDGNPGYPGPGALWDLAQRADVTIFGAGAAYFHGLVRSGFAPEQGRDLSRIRCVGSTGSPLLADAYGWMYEHLGRDLWVVSGSGGTDVASAFLGGCPLEPLRAGELQVRCLGAAVEAWDEDGRAVIDQVGELVITRPMPSMPVGFWNDPDGARYREAYFSTFPGVWRHGDWIRITPQGSAVIYGRSDSTINRAGIRIGTAEIYRPVLAVAGVRDALTVDVPASDGASEGEIVLFVVLDEEVELDAERVAAIREAVRRDGSPRHVPDRVVAAPDVPRTLTGKLLEVPVKRLLMGRDPSRAANPDALANPQALEWFVQYSRRREPVAPVPDERRQR